LGGADRSSRFGRVSVASPIGVMVDALAHRTDQHDDARVRSSALHGCIVAVLLVGCANATETSTAHDAFVKAYACASDDITLRPVPRSEWPTGTWNETAEHDERLARFIAVAGCGHDVQYRCEMQPDRFASHPPRTSQPACTERRRSSYEATDGSRQQAWADADGDAAKEAAVLSASHDIPCGRASVVVVGRGTGDSDFIDGLLEGCGQRVTYKLVDYDGAPSGGGVGPVKGHRYTLVGRTPIPPSTPPP
jgi:hypothetical protein